MKYKNSKFINKIYIYFILMNIFAYRMKKQYDNLKIRCSEHEQRIQQLITLLNEKQIHIDDLHSEKR
jgi:hypothetical protein